MSVKKLVRMLFLVLIPVLLVAVGAVINIQQTKRKVAGVQTTQNIGRVRGMVLPHHGVARELAINAFEKIKNEDYENVVIIGPNHYQSEAGAFVTDKIMWEALRGEFPEIVVDEALVEGEHSIMMYVPIVHEYFPEARLLPLVVSPIAGRSRIDEIAVKLGDAIDGETLFIASVDFSHNEMVDRALLYNDESIRAIADFDYERIYKFGDEHMDSPLSITLLMKIMEERRAVSWEVWDSTHAAVLSGYPDAQGTSYVTGVFR